MTHHNRACFTLLLLAALLLTAIGLGNVRRPTLFAQQTARGGLGARATTLQESLEKGLKARRPQEFEFLKRVVDLVEDGTLPLAMVQSTFDWARHKRPYPIPYFERALKIRAARVGIRVR